MSNQTENERIGALVLDHFKNCDPEFSLIFARCFAGVYGIIDSAISELRTTGGTQAIERLEELAEDNRVLALKISMACLENEDVTGMEMN